MAGRQEAGGAVLRRGLLRNRDFRLLVAGQLLSSAGSQLTAVAYPLLVLAITGSAARAGAVGFIRLLPSPLLALVAGDAADRWPRRRIMIAADAVRATAILALAGSIAAGDAGFWAIAAAAAVEGTGGVFFSAAQTGALRSVVPAPQLPAAISFQTARTAIVSLVGPPLGGLLFTIGRALPFLADACSYLFSFGSLLAMRTPFQQPRQPADPAPLRRRVGEGFRFLWGHPFLRATTLIYAGANVGPPALFLVLVVAGRAEGLSAGRIGLLYALFSAFLLLGSAIAPLCRRRLSLRTIILLELWLSLGAAAYLVWPSVYVLAVAILPQAAAMPVTDSVVVGYRVAITPDHLLGRSEGVRATLAQMVAPLGPLLAGWLLDTVSTRQTVAVFVLWSLALAVWATLTPGVRNPPRLAELEMPA